MTTELKVNASVTATGDEAAAKLKALAGSVADAKIELQRAKAEAKALDTEIKALNKSTDGAGKVTAEYHNRLREITSAQTLAADAARKAQAAFDAQANGINKVAAASGQARASTAQLGQQIGDITQGLAAGTPVATIFAQQAGQVAFAMQGMGGAIGKVGALLSGPWGAIALGTVTILGSMATAFFKTGDSAKKAGEGLDEFSKRQSNIANFIDATTGALIEQNKTLVRNAVLTREAAIAKSRGEITDTATSAQKLLQTSKTGLQQVDPRTNRLTFKFFDKDLGAVAAIKDIEAQDAALQALAARRPELRDLAAAFSDEAAAAVLAAREIKKNAAEIDQLSGKTTGATKASAGLIEKQVALATATTALERARAAYSIVQAQGDAATKAGTAATEAWRAKLTEAANAVNAAEAAERAATGSRQSLTKETNAAEKATRALAAAEKARAEYLYGISGNRTASQIVADAPQRQPDALETITTGIDTKLDKAWASKLGNDVGDTAGAAFAETASAAASVIGQIIGGKAGSTIQSAVQLLGGLKVGSGGGIGSAIGGSAGSAFTQAFTATNQATVKKLGDVLGNVFGSNGTKFASMAGSAFAGASQGQFASSIASAIGIKQNATGAAIGGALGTALTPILGPLGPILGGLVGGTLGNLLIKPPKGSTTVSSSGGNVSQTSSGDPTVQKATSALGTGIGSAISAIAEQLGGSVGSFKVSIGQSGKYYRVDGSGAGRTDKKKAGVQAFGEDQAAAVQAAIADAIRDGGIAGVSPRVQSALQRYATDVNKAVAEAMKVKGLEDLLANQANPFASAFKDFETQAEARLKVARSYGFDVLAIEKLNAEQRAAVIQQTLSQATGSVRQLLDDLKFGDRAEGSISDRRTALVAEQNRLAGLVRGGDSSQLNGLSSVVQKLLDLDKEAGGVAGGFAGSRASSIDLLNELVTQTEDRIKAASAAAQSAANGTADKTAAQLAELNATSDDQYGVQQMILTELRNLNANFASGGGAAGITRSLDLSSFTRVL